MRSDRISLLLVILCTSAPSVRAQGVEVFEVSSENVESLPKGKEADGIRGDFVLRNEHVEALVSGNLPDRKANMAVHWNLPTPGCLYDLAVRGSENDQLTFFGPGSLQGTISHVRVIGRKDNPLEALGVRTERTPATGEGRGQRHDYLLADDWRFVAILSTYRNERDDAWELDPRPRWREFSTKVELHGILTGDATNPSDRQGYAAAVSEWTGELRLGEPAGRVALQPGEEKTFLTIVAPGRSPAAAYGVVAALKGPIGGLHARLEASGRPVTTATVSLARAGGKALAAYTDDGGTFEVALPPGEYGVEVRDLGRPVIERRVVVREGAVTNADFALAEASRIEVETRRAGGGRMPCKIQFFGLDGTADPHFGVDIQAHGCRNVFMSETGHVVQQVDPGRYRLVITRGIEFDHAVREVEVGAGELVSVSAELERVVRTPGWVSTDFHNHSTPSGDNYCGTDDRVINLAVEQIEFAPTTEHNRIYDWTPHIRRLGLEAEISTVVGIELTGSGAHFNSFPLEVVPHEQDGGAPHWHPDPRVTAIVLRDFQRGGPYRWVQLNHPNVGELFRDRDGDGVPDGGYRGLEMLVDASEVWSLNILDATPKVGTRPNRTFAWLQLLNQGMRMNCVAVSDAHAVFNNAVGGWRTYVKSSKDAPAEIVPEEVIRNSKAGRMFMTTGPFLEVALDDGTEIGGSTVVRGPFFVDVKVQCTDWIDINRVQVLVNGRQPEALNFTREEHPELFRDGVLRFEHRIPVRLHEDAHLIVAAIGEGLDLSTGWGKAQQAAWAPCAFTNPIYVDIDGKGFEPNGDTLGHPLPVGK